MVNFVIVVFNKYILNSESVNYFLRFNNINKLNNNCQIIIYDNSLQKQVVPMAYKSIISYVHDSSNGGVCSAYNYGLSLSKSTDDWLVLLDQDSELPENYIENILQLTTKCNDDSTIVAIVPHVLCKKRIISPCNVHLGGKLCPIALDYSGKYSHEIRAINSGMAVRASFMNQIGGFNNSFWLDYLDYWLCRTIFVLGKKIYVSGSIIKHNLSVDDYNQISVQRAKNILHAEVLFYRKYMPWHEQILYVFRLLCRSLKQLLTVNNKNIAFNTMRAIPTIYKKQHYS